MSKLKLSRSIIKTAITRLGPRRLAKRWLKKRLVDTTFDDPRFEKHILEAARESDIEPEVARKIIRKHLINVTAAAHRQPDNYSRIVQEGFNIHIDPKKSVRVDAHREKKTE